MKTITKILTAALICQFAICPMQLIAQNVSISSTGTAPNTSALLDVDAAPGNNKGLLLPRLSTTERNAIVAPAQSLLIYNTTDSCFQGYIGTQWVSFGCNGSGSTPPPPIIFPCAGIVTPIVDVTNVFTGKTWMDRNLGASQVATSSTDAAAYGCLYQWGRLTDGHESRTSGTTATLSLTDTPGHADFITTSGAPLDWRSPQNNTLWQGVAGTNNPCPTGYRLPTELELDAERLSWVQPPISSTNTIVGAFTSPLKLTAGGFRNNFGALTTFVGTDGHYWSSTISFNAARYLNFNSGAAGMFISNRADGLSVRCIKD
ncbi:MAG: hypothetical protein CVT98_01400 [Bacteroidetes bacterium HGW-Bacteroidetes-15]|nr:MAG: hypothetical protein CVT98_01400 [Bacteroidetes bacterium HGW-Bacteroidetes-15]